MLQILQGLMTVVMLLVCVAYFSLFERKMLGLTQFRLGPNKVGPTGIFQPLSDAPKLLTKSIQAHMDPFVYAFVTFLSFLLSLTYWISIPIKFTSWSHESDNMGIWVVIGLSLSVYGAVTCGWFSHSKFSVLGSTRAIAQCISFELVLSIILLSVFGFSSCTSILSVCMTQLYAPNLATAPLLALGVWVSLLAESGRSPFDLPEGESELVSGFNVEYGGVRYILIYLSESVTLMVSCMIMNSLFLGVTYLFPMLIWVIVSILLRSSLPRMRFDRCMTLGWVTLLSSSISYALVMILTLL
nr:NADH dehydrogenase subunit 1 [Pthirus gorillae]